ncbi:MAG: DNA-3-methyladenine glycosylase [Thermoleophilia bacterium]
MRPPRVLVRLPYREPLAAGSLVRALRAHLVPGLERLDDDGALTRVVRAPGGPAIVRVEPRPGTGEMRAELRPSHPADVAHLLLSLRRSLDLDHDPAEADAALARDPLLAPLVAARPGLRVPGGGDGFEAAVLVVLGQQVSVAAARTFAGRLVTAYGTPAGDGLSAFPTAHDLAFAHPGDLRAAVGLTGARAGTLHSLARAVADGLVLDASADPARTREDLLALPGIGPWTAELIALRALGDRDALPSADLVLRRALGGVGPAEAERRAEPWRPFRAYALMHLWTHVAFEPPPASRNGAPGRVDGGRPMASAHDGRMPR